MTAVAERPATRSFPQLPAPRGLPGVGHALQLRPARLHLVLEAWARRLGPLYRVQFGPRPVVVVADPELIHDILRERPAGYRRWREVEAVFKELGIHGVFSAEGEDWRRQRRLAVTALNANHVQRFYDVIRVSTERLRGRFSSAARHGGPFDIQDAFTAFTTDVTSALAFGHDLNTLERDSQLQRHIGRVLPLVNRRISAPFPYWRLITPPADRAAERSLEIVRAAVAGFIADARARMAAQPERHAAPENFLEGMLAAQPDGHYSDDEVFGNTLTMLLAGEDTTAHTLAWAAGYLARDPLLQARLAADARALLGESPVPPDAATADAFTLGDAVLRETMRLKSAAPLLFLETLEDTALAGVALPAGTRLIALGRYVDAMPDPTFDPDRDPSRLLTFGAGPRFCPGRNLALLEARSALAMLTRGFELRLDPHARPVRERFGFTMEPEGLRVLVRERTR